MWKSLSVPDMELQGLQEVIGMLEERKNTRVGITQVFLASVDKKVHTFCHNDGRDYFICMDGNCFRTEVIKAMWKSLSVPDIELQGLQEVVGMLEERKALVLG